MAHRWTSAGQVSDFSVWEPEQEGSGARGESPSWNPTQSTPFWSMGGKTASW